MDAQLMTAVPGVTYLDEPSGSTLGRLGQSLSFSHSGRLIDILSGMSSSTGERDIYRLRFVTPSNLRVIELLQLWIDEDDEAASPTLGEEMAEFSANRFNLPERW